MSARISNIFATCTINPFLCKKKKREAILFSITSRGVPAEDIDIQLLHLHPRRHYVHSYSCLSSPSHAHLHTPSRSDLRVHAYSYSLSLPRGSYHLNRARTCVLQLPLQQLADRYHSRQSGLQSNYCDVRASLMHMCTRGVMPHGHRITSLTQFLRLHSLLAQALAPSYLCVSEQ